MLEVTLGTDLDVRCKFGSLLADLANKVQLLIIVRMVDVTGWCGCQDWWRACVPRGGACRGGGVDGEACSGGWSWWMVIEEVLLLDWQWLAASGDYPHGVADAAKDKELTGLHGSAKSSKLWCWSVLLSLGLFNPTQVHQSGSFLVWMWTSVSTQEGDRSSVSKITYAAYIVILVS